MNQTVVDPDDPAFTAPAKFIGAGYSRAEAERAAARFRWVVAVDGDRWRRVVPSPEPLRVVEEGTIRALVDRDVVVVCGGGGGAPVAEDRIGRLTGVEAVVDKDMTAARLALTLRANRLLVLTDVPAVMRDFGTPKAAPIRTADAEALAVLPFPDGSTGPKIEACVWFARASGRPAAIGPLSDAADVLAGRAGTTIAPVRQQAQVRS